MADLIRENWVYILFIIFFIFIYLFEYGCNRCVTQDREQEKGDQKLPNEP